LNNLDSLRLIGLLLGHINRMRYVASTFTFGRHTYFMLRLFFEKIGQTKYCSFGYFNILTTPGNLGYYRFIDALLKHSHIQQRLNLN